MTLVCIGIPFYNAEKYLDYAIQSVLNQTYANWELLLLDDGSTDSSLLLARQYENDVRITIISDGQNKGLVYRLNQLIELSKCKYFARMDADDIMHPERLEKQFNYLEEHLEVNIIGSWAYSINKKNEIIGILKNKISPTTIKDVFTHSCFIHPTIMGRKEWFKNNLYDSTSIRMEDMELWCRTIENSTFRNLPEPLLFYREVGMPYLSKYLLSMQGERLLARQYYKKEIIKQYSISIISWIKSIIYSIFSVFRMQDILIKRRSCRIDDISQQKANLDLSIALNRTK